MDIAEEKKEEYLSQARKLVTELEGGNAEEAARLIDDIAKLREQALFQDLGRLTRELHDAMTGFLVDSKLSEMTDKEIPDAKERLRHVIEMTDKAASRTMDVVEESLPVCDKLESTATEIHERWERFTRREMKPDEFRQLSRELGDFLGVLNADIGLLKSGLNEVLMAQDFQDLTGQIIGRVINLVGDVEDNLVEIIKIGGNRLSATVPQKKDEKAKPADAADLDGPQVPGIESATAVSGQDEVDDLLSSLGF
jgi:chemotaxis protein CheZ